MKRIKFIGMDVHKKSIDIAIADGGENGEVRHYGSISNELDSIQKFIRKIVSTGAELRFAYEAGPCGYVLYRYLTGNGFRCMVVAPSLIPKKSGCRIKNDRRDAMELARLYRSGELTAVHVPEPEDEAMRDLTRAREDAKVAERKAKQHLSAFLLRHGQIYGGRTPWSKSYVTWLEGIAMPHPAQQFTLQEYINTVREVMDRVLRITEQIRQLLPQWRLAPVVAALQSLRGVAMLVAVTTIAEVGDLGRFDKPSQLMAFLGLVPSEHSSGEKVRKGSITKTGNGHVRRILMEAAAAYRLPARVSTALSKRLEGQPQRVREIAWKAQVRLCARYRRMINRGKPTNVVTTAIAREVVAFMWAIAKETATP